MPCAVRLAAGSRFPGGVALRRRRPGPCQPHSGCGQLGASPVPVCRTRYSSGLNESTWKTSSRAGSLQRRSSLPSGVMTACASACPKHSAAGSLLGIRPVRCASRTHSRTLLARVERRNPRSTSDCRRHLCSALASVVPGSRDCAFRPGTDRLRGAHRGRDLLRSFDSPVSAEQSCLLSIHQDNLLPHSRILGGNRSIGTVSLPAGCAHGLTDPQVTALRYRL
jgi:hypothetical protein